MHTYIHTNTHTQNIFNEPVGTSRILIEARYVDASHTVTRTATTRLSSVGQLSIRAFTNNIDEVFVTLSDSSADATDYVDVLRTGISISSSVSGTDTETLVMTETGPTTSIFTGVIPVQVCCKLFFYLCCE